MTEEIVVEDQQEEEQADARTLPDFWQDAQDRVGAKQLRPNIVIIDEGVDKVYRAPLCEVKEISIDKLLPSKHYSRCDTEERRLSSMHRLASMKTLAESIMRFGLRELPRVKQNPTRPGYYEVMDGHRRIEAMKTIGWTSCNCKVYRADLDSAWVLFFQGIGNLTPWQRGKRQFSLYESGIFLRKIMQETQQNEEDIKKTFGLEDGFVRCSIELAELLDRSSEGLSYEDKQLFLANLDNDKIDFLFMLKTWEEAQDAARKILKGATLKELTRVEETKESKRQGKEDVKQGGESHDESTELQEDKETISKHQKVVELREQGLSYRDIEKKLKDISRSTAYNIVRDHSKNTCSCQTPTPT